MSATPHLDKKMPILVVDNFSTMRRFIRKLLSDLGYTNVTEASGDEDTRSKLRENEFKLIIGDWNITQSDILHQLRTSPKLKQSPLLFVSTVFEKDQMHTFVTHAREQVIVKPFSANILREKMESVFEEPGKS